MTTWREVEDLGLDEERDDLDPAAAPGSGPVEEQPEVDAEYSLDNDDELRGPWTPLDGFADRDRAVRVWVDDDVTISRVRVSSLWRERVGEKRLTNAFLSCFFQINNHFRSPLDAMSFDGDGREASEPLSWDGMWALLERNRRIAAEVADLGPEDDGRWVGACVTGVSPDRTAAITLNVHGLLDGIEFNRTWLASARGRQIGDAVVRAHRHAKAQFVPPTYEEGKRDQLLQEMADNRFELLAMMRRGFK